MALPAQRVHPANPILVTRATSPATALRTKLDPVRSQGALQHCKADEYGRSSSIVHCTNCGAQLLAENLNQPGCPYCGAALPHELRARERAQLVKQLLEDKNHDGIPDAFEPLLNAAQHGQVRAQQPVRLAPTPRPATPPGYAGHRATPLARASAAQKKRGSGCVVFMALLGVLVAGAGTAAVLFLSSADTQSLVTGPVGKTTVGSQSPQTSPKSSWSASAPGCPIDANGDGVDDHVGMSSEPNQPDAVTVVDGATGKILHAGKSYPQSSEAYCLDERWYVVAQPNFTLDFYDARNPEAPVSISARDKLSEFGMGDGCAAFKTADGTSAGVTLPGGTSTACKAEPMHRIYDAPPGLLGLTTKSGAVTVGRRVYTLTKRQQGTEILTVTVTQGKREIWSKELPYASATFSSAIAVAGNKIVLWAAEPANRRVGILVGLDEKTGKQLYAKPQGQLTSNSIQYIGYNGRYVVVAWSSGLFAYDPNTGEVAWHLGRGL